MQKIVTMCRQGLVRSVALADVLKLHFQPVDVIPIGHFGNTQETRRMLFDWCDHIIIMEDHYKKHVWPEYHHKLYVCEVGPDTYGHSRNKDLINKVWKWAEENSEALSIQGHSLRL